MCNNSILSEDSGLKREVPDADTDHSPDPVVWRRRRLLRIFTLGGRRGTWCGWDDPPDCAGSISAWHVAIRMNSKETAMKESTKDEAKGKFHEVKGKVKEKEGRATNNPALESEGHDEKIDGKVQKKIGQVEKVLNQ
jgi:uncharacterized protein YjbJ (UPF0337 family)